MILAMGRTGRRVAQGRIRPSETFTFTPHASNPLISGTTFAASYYVPCVIKVGATWHIAGKSDDRTFGFTSVDGVAWSGQTLLIGNGSGRDFDSDHSECSLFQYDNASTYYLWFGGRDSSGIDSIGLATSSIPFGTYSKSPGSSDAWYSPSDYAADLPAEPSMDAVWLGDHFILEGTHFWIAHALPTVGVTRSPARMWYGTSNGWTAKPVARGVLFTAADVATELRKSTSDFVILQAGSCIRRNGNSLWMHFECGRDGDVYNERRIYAVRINRSGDTLTADLSTLHVARDSDRPGGLADRRAYQPRWHKEQDGEYLTPVLTSGKYRMYYSIHDVSFPTQDAFGITGLLETTQIPGAS